MCFAEESDSTAETDDRLATTESESSDPLSHLVMSYCGSDTTVSDPNALNSSEPSLYLSETSSEAEPQEALGSDEDAITYDQWLELATAELVSAPYQRGRAAVTAGLVAAVVVLVAITAALIAGIHHTDEPDEEEDNGAGIGW